jgi:hypothetical protein
VRGTSRAPHACMSVWCGGWSATLAAVVVVCGANACMPHERAAELALKDPRNAALETRNGERVLARGAARGAIPGSDTDVRRDPDGAIEVDGRTVVGRDGRVYDAGSADRIDRGAELRAPVCFAWRKRGCREITIVTPLENVRSLRAFERPVRFVGIMELLIAGSLLTWGAVTERDPGNQTTSGGAILLTSGTVFAIVGLLQTFGGERNAVTIVGGGR